MSLISVIVPIYNSSSFLDKCILSILGQTLSDLEVVLVDDGSSDGSRDICDRYAASDDRIKVIHKPVNEGLVRARQTGINEASSDLIGFVDSDDWIEPDMFEKLYRVIKSEQVDVAMCGRFEESDGASVPVYHGIPEGRYEGRELCQNVFPKMIVNGGFFDWGLFPGYWDKLFFKEVLYDHLMRVDDRIAMGEDAAGTYPCLLFSKSIYVVHECLYHYRQFAGSMVRGNGISSSEEHTKFKILYESVRCLFERGRDIYDLREQWKEYLLFLMTPRADVLYENLRELQYLFPFPEVKKGSKVIIYGAGLWGQRMYSYLKRSGFCDAVALADKDHERLNRGDMNVISPEDICDTRHDAVIVTASYARTRRAIMDSLRAMYPNDRIYEPDLDEIFSEKTMKAFGLS